MSDVESARVAKEAKRALSPAELFVVGVGAPAGGLDAIERLFRNMPEDSGMAFVVVQHLSPNFESLMDELLARHTKIPIHRVTDGMQLEPNGIYLIPPKKNMVLSNSKLLLTDQDSDGSLNLPINIFFRSLAQDAGKRAIGIVLSGTGSDGSHGIREIHENGGLVLVQDLESASFDGMPRSAASTDIVDVVCPPEKMAEKLISYVGSPAEFARGDVYDSEEADLSGDRFEIFRLFRHRFGIDFSLYKPATIDRRIERRVQLSRSIDLKQYVEKLRNDFEEIDLLYRDLLVEVTQFFRDSGAFRILRSEIIPQMVKSAAPESEIRVWVPGCATGEEAYSLAILFDEAIAASGKEIALKVFATDVHQRSLEIASAGVYSAPALENVPHDLQKKYFAFNSDLFHVVRELRQKVIFASNNLTADPPFTRVDLISCRNLLIYLEPKVQKKVLSLFHFGLKTGGVLFLGPSESLGEISNEFETLDRHWKVFRKQRDASLPLAGRLSMTTALSKVVPPTPSFVAKSPVKTSDPIYATAFQELLSKYVPPSLMVNEHYELVHTFGDATKLLSQPEGRSTLDVLKMVRGDLRVAVSAALHKAGQQRSAIVYKGVRVSLNKGKEQHYKLVVEPYMDGGRSMFLVSFEEMKQPASPERSEQNFDAQEQSSERIEVLEQELSYTRESLQSTVEQLETSNEELQSTNEELIASNEELQSTNEELHSVNEELYTVNSEHKQKIEELTQLSSDIDNLLKSTDIGAVFLGRDLCIRMYTPAIAPAFNMLDQDIGRPIEHIAFRLSHPGLLTDIQSVMDQGKPIERECREFSGDRTFLFRVIPYRDAAGRLDGVALTVTDISAIKAVEAAQQKNLDLAQANKDLQDFAYAVSHDLQAPLRHITDACFELKRSIEESREDQTSKFLRLISDSSAGATKMIQDLLTYSRVATRGKRFELVDCQLLFDEASEDLDEIIREHSAKVTANGLGTIKGDDRQLKTVLIKMIDNGIRYCGSEPPRVHVECQRNDHELLFSVKDNGVGIEERHYDRIFVIFQRLKFKPEVAGNGLGLALCKRIVERHGGRIWVESVPGEGATFYFTIPV